MSLPAVDVDDRRPFSVPQLAERWGCSDGLVRKLIRDGELQCFRPGALIRISAAEVEKFECRKSNQSIPSRSSAVDSLSYGGEAVNRESESADDANLIRKIGRARRRKPAGSGKKATIHPGPWAG